ncbi:MAG: ATP-dependent Clp protease ATP-binding subunit [Proteobacteria bacterium]|nr:ATP-dependent Clp protease ATP-binding subunit [Pseudomonadota bacterium]
MIDLSNYREYLSEKSSEVLSRAIDESKKRQHYYLGTEHIFLAFMQVEKGFLQEILTELRLDPDLILRFLEEHLTVSKQYLGVGLKIPPSTKNAFKQAWEEAQHAGRKMIEPIDLLVAIFQELEGVPIRIFKSLGIEPEVISHMILIKARSKEKETEELKKRFELPPHLKYFGVNLNKLARMGKLPHIFGRENEINQMIEILCHRERSNSVMIIGEPGVGKTAIVEGLAMKLEFEPHTIPYRLRNHQIVNLQMNSIVAGTVFRGMFEDRVEKIINELKERKNLILFVDEAHTIIGAGSALGVHGDAANIFKSTLARGEVQIIGATTREEYKMYIQEDEALARRFRVVDVRESSLADTRKILYGVRTRLENNYGVKISDEGIEEALSLAPRYQHSLRLPDKPISWLDTSCVKVEINRPDDQVKAKDIVEVVSQEARVPIDMVYRDTTDRLHNMEEAIAHRIVGQKEAITALTRALRLNKGPLKENFDKPDGVLLFLGPTGVGKTEMAKALAEFLFGDDKKMVRIDMSEYRDSTAAIDKLIGMPRGIVGSERGGILTNQIRDNPYTVLLMDEMEKANSYVLNLFLQVFDEGWLTDGRGKRVYFSDTVIIMTSNLGSDKFKKFTNPLGFLSDPDRVGSAKKAIMREVEDTFSPEFLNRIDNVVVFDPLTKDEVKQIAAMYLEKIYQQLQEHGKKVEVTDEALEYLVKVGFSEKYGARFLKRIIDEKVKIPLTIHWKEGSIFTVDMKDGELWISWKDEEQLVDTALPS